jgi:hypothetical protein
MNPEMEPSMGQSPEQEPSVPKPEASLESLAQSLGFVETPAMTELRLALVAEPDVEVRKSRLVEYHDLGIEVCVAQKDDEAYGKARIGLTVAMARLYLETGFPDGAADALDDALVDADNLGYTEIGDQIATLANGIAA